MNLFFKSVLLTSIIAGTLDILAAYTRHYILTQHVSKKIFHYIAGGALGLKRSINGGIGVIVTGIIIHYFIAFAFTLFFFLYTENGGLNF